MAPTAYFASHDKATDGRVADSPQESAGARSRIAAAGGVACVVFAADQLAKSLALQLLAPSQPVLIVEGMAAFTLVLNPGLAFGILRQFGAEAWWLMALLSVVALTVLARVAVTMLREGGLALAAALGLIFGGALGNLVDRVRLGAVVDFIDLSWGPYHWPAFNTADSAVSIGVTLLIGHLFMQGSTPTGRASKASDASQKESSR